MPTTVEDIRDSVRFEIRDPSGVIHQDDDVDDAIRKAYPKVFIYVLTKNQDYFITADDFDTVSGTSVYALPDDHRRTKSINILTSAGDEYPIYEYRRGSSPAYNSTLPPRSVSPFTYEFQDASVIFTPTPQSVVEIRHRYYPGPAELVDETTEVNSTFDKKELIDWVVLEAARMLFGRIEATGGYVSPDIKERIKEQKDIVDRMLNLRTLSPRRQRRKGYFE